MATLFREDFDDLPAGPLPADFSAVGEYHFAPPEGEMGPWYEPSRDYRNRSPWVVLEDEGDHVLLQPFVTNEHWPRLLVAGTVVLKASASATGPGAATTGSASTAAGP